MTDNTPNPDNLEDLSLKSFLERSTPDTFKPIVSVSLTEKNETNPESDQADAQILDFLTRDNNTKAFEFDSTDLLHSNNWDKTLEAMRAIAAKHPGIDPLEVVEMKLKPINFEDISGFPQPDNSTGAATLNDKIGKLRQDNNTPINDSKGIKPV